jgi:hypothetical protein
VTTPGTTWQVRMPDGQVRGGSPEQLEEAVRAGHLDARTMVLPPGAPQWVPLPTALEGIANARSRSPAAPPQAPAPAPAVAETPAAAPPPPAPAPEPSQPTPLTAPVALERQADASPPDSPESEESKTDVGAAAGDESLWQVKLTAAQLAAAFQAGIIQGDTQVMESGTDQWVALSSVASG